FSLSTMRKTNLFVNPIQSFMIYFVSIITKAIITFPKTFSWMVLGKCFYEYFGKSRSWLSQKMNGKDGNGADVAFTDAEKEQLKFALNDLAKRIQICAEKL